MFLKSLEIQGFKSFADKVTFTFSPGVTAIVGPNGSGKSNVVDAIRWVLGEQSAKTLRGARMEDVIFSGSVDRRPVGMARVTMTLDNSQRVFALDSDEIEVSRTLYRSGESNYMLNKASCRLRDIQELFMDTGLGKDGFSVIGQGKIEEILTLHAEERRGLIEEAAGISKYKYRKREAERKLASTNDDMTRLDDMLYDLEQRLDPLAKQAEKVRVYRGLKAELDTLQLAYLTQQLLREQDHLDVQRREAEAAHETALHAQTALDQQEAALTEAKQHLARERHEMEEAQSAYTDSLRQTQEHEKQLSLLAQQHDHAEERLTSLSASLAEAETQRMAAAENVAALAAQLEETTAAVAAIREEAATSQEARDAAEAEVAALKTAIDEGRSQQFAILSEQAANNNTITRLEQALQGDQARSDRVDSRLDELQTQQTALAAEIDEKETAATQLEDAARETQSALEKLAADGAALQQQLQTQQGQAQQVSQQLMQAQSRLDTLEEFEASGEGYYQGVQAVLRAKKEGRLSGIHGSVLQLLEIPTAYLTAIENALGGAAQNVVVADDRDARAAIAWLKKERRGRATFMPLNLVRGGRQDIDFDDEAVLGLALDLVQYDPQYEAVMAQLLGRVWVLRDLESATALARRTGARHRFVTLEGDVIAPGGSMTGGHQKKQSSIVYRKHEMGTLKEKIATLGETQRQLQEAVAQSQSRLDTLQAAQERGRARLQEQQLAQREAAVVLEQLQEQARRLEREQKLEQMNRDELSAQRATAQQDLANARETAATIAAQLEELAETLARQQQDLADAESALQAAGAALQAVLVRKATSDEQHQHQQERWREATADAQRLTTACERDSAERDQLSAQLAELSEALAAEKGALADAQQQHASVDAAMQTAKQTIDALDEAIREQESTVAEARRHNEKSWRSHNSAEMRRDRAAERVAQLGEQLMESFGYSPEAALAAADLEQDTSEAPARLKTLREKIARLGEINFTALEEYEHVSEQASFLQAQIEDLRLAKEKLESVIREMEATMAQRFKVAYERVNSQFAEIFTAMFGGGSARLELSMPGRYLETGVEIVAQPPGKKERVLTLLSGGERALTATALLFALLEVRPSPFVILDEIEAALDEANVERFASFILQYTNKTQFIIISHRKGTMEAASVLYGITMDANGVSKQVSVRLSDFNDEQEA